MSGQTAPDPGSLSGPTLPGAVTGKTRGQTMRSLATALLAMTALLPWLPAQADDNQGFDVLKAMSVADFRATGLDHLTDAQIKALDAWFADYQRSHFPCAATAATPVMAAPAAPATAATSAGEVIVAHL